MAKVHYISKSKKTIKCEKCGKTFEPGVPYKWVSIKTGPRSSYTHFRCETCPTWRPSELSNSKMAPIHEAQSEFSIEDLEDSGSVEEARDQFAAVVREASEGYTESADNMESGFGHSTSVSDEVREKADGLSSWADEIEGVDIPDEDDYRLECDECDGGGKCAECGGTGIKQNDEDVDEECENCGGDGKCPECSGTGGDGEVDLDRWREEFKEELEELVQNCPV